MLLRKISIILLLAITTIKAETFHLVEGGKLNKKAIKIGNSWQQKPDYVTGNSTGQFLNCPQLIKSGNFQIKATLALSNIGSSAAGNKLGGALFGLDSPNGFFVEGTGFSKEFFKKDLPQIKDNVPFNFLASMENGNISFYINNALVTKRPFNQKSIQIGVRPHRAKVKIYNFSVEGNLFTPKPLPYVFKSGENGYHTYRIPAIVRSTKGTLLAFAEGRVNHSGDSGNLDIVLRRSTDNGKTWEKLIIVQDDGNNQCGNAAPVVDQASGRIFMLSCGSTSSEHAVMQGKATREIYIQHSDDDGKTWTKRRNISAMTRKKDWRWYATGPCSGIQIQEGKYKGRLIIPANHSFHGDGKHDYRAHSLYSDDLGETWHIGTSAAKGSNESQIAESGKNKLYHTMRMQTNRQGMRGTRYSKDGGATWTALQHDDSLHGPRCQGSVIRDYSQPSRLIFSNPAKFGRREDMTIRISENGGKTWPFRKQIFTGSAAYSDLVITKDQKVGALFEAGYSRYADGIIFYSFDKKELLTKEPAESQIPVAKMGWNIWRDRFNSFNNQAQKGDIDLLLIGDSITHYWQKNKMCGTNGQKVWDKYFADKKVANFGIGSDRTQHLLYRLKNGNLKNIQPKAVVLMIGTNNTSSSHSAYDIFLGTRDIIKEIQKQCPKTKIFLYDIFPRIRGGQPAKDNNDRANRLIKELCDGKSVIDCSINSKLLDAYGQPDKKIFFDGIHLNEKGYEIWANDILSKLKSESIELK